MLEISSVSIVLNEAPYIESWIDYHRDRFGEMIIIDGGSTDNTVELIEAKGIIPFYKEWKRDYSLQRNFSIEKANFDWVFVLDVDHRVSDELSGRFSEFIVNQNHYCYEVPFIHYVNGLEVGRNHYMNFFKKSSGIKYWRNVHEGVCDKHGYAVKDWMTLPDDCCVRHIKDIYQYEKSLKNWISYGEEDGRFTEGSAAEELAQMRRLLGL